MRFINLTPCGTCVPIFPDMPHRTPARFRSAFTLVEMLVTVAVIAILAALLLPSVRGVLDRGKRVQTVSNLRQVTGALRLYLNDNDMTLPLGYVAGGGPLSVSYTNWLKELARSGYLGTPDHPDSDPSNQLEEFEFSVLGSPLQRQKNPNPQKRGHWNTFSGNSLVLDAYFSTPTMTEKVRVVKFDQPSKTVVAMEGSTFGNTTPAAEFNSLMYPTVASTWPDCLADDKCSFLFLDGHVETLALKDVPGYPSYGYETSGTAWLFWRGRQ